MLLAARGGMAGRKSAGRESKFTLRLLAGLAGGAPFGVAWAAFQNRDRARWVNRARLRIEFDQMNASKKTSDSKASEPSLASSGPVETLITELLILPDGQILVHNLTQ